MAEDLAAIEELGFSDQGFSARQKAVLRLLWGGNTRRDAYRSAGVSKPTFYRWMSENETFRDCCESAESQAVVSFVDVVRKCALGGVLKKRTTRTFVDGSTAVTEEWTLPDFRAAQFWLGVRRAEWKAREPIDLGRLTDEQITSLLEDEDQVGGEPEGTEETDPDGEEESGVDPDGEEEVPE